MTVINFADSRVSANSMPEIQLELVELEYNVIKTLFSYRT
jgi:hypothetical protein